MKSGNLYGIFWLIALLFSCVIISSCKQNSRVSTDAKTVSMHFDSAYRYVVNNMVVANSNPDTFLSLCDDMTSVSPSLLEPRQVRQWAHSYALAASVYISNNDLKKALVCLHRGMAVADSLGDIDCLNRASNLLALVYSNWKLNDEANALFDRILSCSEQTDALSKANAYMAKAMHMVYTEKYDSAAYYMSMIDKLQLKKEDMLSGSYQSVQYYTRFLKGWYLSETPDSLGRAIELLQGLYDEYYPYRDQAISFESVCLRLGRAYDLAGNDEQAIHYYDETKKLVVAKPAAHQMFEVVAPLMDFYLDKGENERILELLPVYKTVSEQYYDYQMNGLLAYYSVELDVAGKEKQIVQNKGLLLKRQMEIVILILVVVLLVVLVIGGIVYWRNKKRQIRTLFEALMRRYVEWREINNYLIDHSVSPSQLPLHTEEEEPAGQIPDDAVSGEEDEEEFYRNLYYRALVVMERERPFLDPDLTIVSLAKWVATNRTHLSTAINRMTGTSFSVWLAEYRVNYVILLMESGKVGNMDDIYEQAGFGSRTSFYRQFKRVTGLTPKQFLERKAF